jgi:hypothetical protein
MQSAATACNRHRSVLQRDATKCNARRQAGTPIRTPRRGPRTSGARPERGRLAGSWLNSEHGDVGNFRVSELYAKVVNGRRNITSQCNEKVEITATAEGPDHHARAQNPVNLTPVAIAPAPDGNDPALFRRWEACAKRPNTRDNVLAQLGCRKDNRVSFPAPAQDQVSVRQAPQRDIRRLRSDACSCRGYLARERRTVNSPDQ